MKIISRLDGRRQPPHLLFTTLIIVILILPNIPRIKISTEYKKIILSIFSDKFNLKYVSFRSRQFTNLYCGYCTLAGHQGYPLTLAHMIYLFENECSIYFYNN